MADFLRVQLLGQSSTAEQVGEEDGDLFSLRFDSDIRHQ